MSSEFPSNVVNSTGHPLDAHGETVFLLRLFDAMSERMGDDFHDYTFVVHRRVRGEFSGMKIHLDPGGPNRVLIILADEREVFPAEEFLSYKTIFRAYGNPTGCGNRIQPFPVGYLNAAGKADSVSFSEREHSVFFSGYMNRNRVDLYKQFRPVFWLPRHDLKTRYTREIARRIIKKFYNTRQFDGALPNARVGFTEWFSKGLPPNEYASILASTKIALCPPGFISNETIRHWEAMRLGCVVISAPLPPNRFYKDSPIIQLTDWSELMPLLRSLLADPEALHQRHEATLAWWNQVCSERAVADYMARVILNS